MYEFLAIFWVGVEVYFWETLPFYWSIAPIWLQLLLIGLLTGILGSFLNMAIWRVPRGESIFLPRSHCPVCKHVLSPLDLLPILSYLLLKGRCRYCGTKFGIRYVLIEIFLVSFSLTAYLAFGLNPIFVAIVTFLALSIFCYGILQHKSLDKNIIDKQLSPVFKREDRGSNEYYQVNSSKRGFTYIEVILTLVIVAAVIIPFGNIFLSSYGRVIKNKEYIMAFNLMEEKMEELRMVPFKKLKDDWHIYAKPSDGTDGIYSGNHTGHFFKMRTDRNYFEENFSDIFITEKDMPRLAMARFKKTYRDYYGFSYEFYPESYKIFRRVVRLEFVDSKLKDKFEREQNIDKSLKKSKSKRKIKDLLKITVQVFIDSKTNSRKLEISRYRRK